MKLDPRQWSYGQWWSLPTPGNDPQLLDPQPPAPPQDKNGNAVGVPAGY